MNDFNVKLRYLVREGFILIGYSLQNPTFMLTGLDTYFKPAIDGMNVTIFDKDGNIFTKGEMNPKLLKELGVQCYDFSGLVTMAMVFTNSYSRSKQEFVSIILPEIANQS